MTRESIDDLADQRVTVSTVWRKLGNFTARPFSSKDRTAY